MNVLVTGSSGLVGSEAVRRFGNRGHKVIGIDNNLRRKFFGPGGDTVWNRERLKKEVKGFEHFSIDIRHRKRVEELLRARRIDVIIHCAAQPSHDKARDIPLTDFGVNALGTVILLEATRRFRPEAVFILMSTNKVYGDAPNRLPLKELRTRWDYALKADYDGIDETCSIDRCLHSVFGASKVAADVMCQEYGRYFGLKTVVFRGGCLTGPRHSAVALHGFLSYLVKVTLSGQRYTIFGYKGKQVRDQIHSLDVVRAMEAFIRNPRPGEVYNLGGGRGNSASILECIAKLKDLTGKTLDYDYRAEPRVGDHICYITNLKKLRSHYPSWDLSYPLDRIIEEMVGEERKFASV